MKNKRLKPEKGFYPVASFVLFTFIAFFFFPFSIYAQGEISKKINDLARRGSFKTEMKVPVSSSQNPSIDKKIDKSLLLDIRKIKSDILKNSPEFISLRIPYSEGNFPLLLYRVRNDVNVITDKGIYKTEHILNYRGTIKGDSSSIASITFSKKEISGIIFTNKGNFNISNIPGDTSGKAVIFNDKNLPLYKFECAEAIRSSRDSMRLAPEAAEQGASGTVKCINWYWETCYNVYQNKGSLASVTTWIQGLFSQVQTLYANDGITVNLKTLKVWTVPDPYVGTTTSDFFNQFTNIGPTTFDGDFATLIGFSGSGGMSWQNEYCDIGKYKKCYCGISPSYAAVPVYSWSVENVAHENGHLLGSPHTHACRWNGNNTAIDGCATTEGGCPNPGLPAGGGTIMSYCHQTSVGINFTLGFGPQPKALITNYINAAACLVSCSIITCTLPAQPAAITGNSAICGNTSQTYSVAAVSGATSYIWVLPSGWTGTSTTNSITTIAGTASGTISVSSVNSCGSSIARTLAVSVTSIASQPGIISGATSVCSNSSQTYSVTAVTGATSYTWTLPAGWTGSSTTNSITAITGSSGGVLSVVANNTCGSSTPRTLSAAVTPAPSQPGIISGVNQACANTSQTYSVTAVAGATSYSWMLPSGWTGSSVTNSITATIGTSGGIISVTANNACGSSPVQTLSATINTIPSQPGVISGASLVCANTSQTYSVTAVPGATSYVWSLPSGWTGSSTTNNLTSTTGIAGGTISVIAKNSCGSSIGRTLATTVTQMPSQPGTISGSVSVCTGSSQTYSITAVLGATSYTWMLPAGWSGNSTTNSITAIVGASGGTISVSANNTCGSSSARTLSAAVNAVPPQPGIISGASSVCASTNQAYSISAVSGTTSYTWIVPAGWTGTSTTNLISTVAGTAGGTLSVTANNTCGSSVARTLSTAVTQIPAQPGIISGNSAVCTNSNQAYSSTAVAGATNYTWQLPSGWTGSSTTNSLAAHTGTSGGTITLTASNVCGTSPTRTLPVVISGSIPSQPGPISGLTLVYPTASQTYSVTSVTGATGYTWVLPTGWSGTSSTNSITTIVGSNGGTISVTANNSCGISAAQTLSVTVGAVLPVTLLNFQGHLSGNVVDLMWQTSQEINLKNFVVEKSTDGISFEPIAAIDAKRVNSLTNYNYTDKYPYPGISYYRLKLVNDDGTFEYSSVVKISRVNEGLMITRFFPNPTNDNLNIEIISDKRKKISIDVFDFSGKMVFKKLVDLKEGVNQQKLFLAPFATGTYLVELNDAQNNIVDKRRIVKL